MMARTIKSCCYVVTSIVGMLMGISAFIAFFCVYQNYVAGVWAILSGVIAAVNVHLHCLSVRNLLETWHDRDTLMGLQLLGVLITLAGCAGFAWYLFTAIYYHIPVLPVATSAYITSVWAFLTFKWGLMLIISSHGYACVIDRDNPQLIFV